MIRVGVVIPVFGHSRFVRDAVASVECQIGVEVDIVVVSDGCKNEDTHQYLNSLNSRREPRVQVIRKKNGGLSSARNAGLEALLPRKPDYIYFLDADNVVTERGLRSAIQDIELARADWAYPNINSLGHSQPDWMVAGDFNPYILTARNYIEAGSLIARRLVDSGLRFDEAMSAGYEDWEFWLSASARGFRGVQSSGLGLRYRNRFESMIADADRARAKLVGVMRNKHKDVYAPHNLAELEAQHFPRLGIIDVRSKRYFENSFKNEKPFDLLLKKLNETLVPGGLEPGPDLLFFVDLGRVSLVGQSGLLLNAVAVTEDICSRGASICSVSLEVTNGKNFGVKLGRPADSELIGLTIRKSLLAEVLKDSDEWLLSQIDDADTTASNGVTIVDEFPPRRGNPAFTRDFVAILAELRQSCALQYRPGFHPLQHLAHGPDARFRDIANDLPVYFHPQNPVLNSVRSNGRARRNVAFVLPFGTFGGVERVTIDVAKVLQDRGVDCHVFFEFTGLIHPDFLFKRAFKTITYLTSMTQTHWSSTANYQGTPGSVCSESDVRRLVSMLMGMDEVVFCHSHLAINAAADLRKLGVKTSSYVHTFDISSDGRMVGWPFFTIGYEHKIDRIYTCSPTMLDEMLMLGVPADKLTNITNATTFNVVQKKSLPGERIKLSFVGRFDTQKGIDRLVPLVNQLRAQNVNFELRMAGSAVLDGKRIPRELEEFVVGQLDSQGVSALMDDTDILLMPSLWEGLPLTMLEAMARGVVPLSSAVGDVPRLSRDCPGVLVVDWDNPTAIVDQITHIHAYLPRLRKQLHDWSKNNRWDKNVPRDAFV